MPSSRKNGTVLISPAAADRQLAVAVFLSMDCEFTGRRIRSRDLVAGPDSKNNTADDIGNWQATDDEQESRNVRSSLPTTWKELRLEIVRPDYPIDGISLINGLNQARGTWTFSGARLESGESNKVVARLTAAGSSKNVL